MDNRTKLLLQWSAEYSDDQPDIAALLARTAGMILSRMPRKVVDLQPSSVDVPVQKLPAIKADFNMTRKRQQIFEIIRDLPGSTIAEVAVLMQTSRENINRSFLEMEEAGLIVREAGVPNGTTRPPLRWFLRQDKSREGVA